MKSPLNPNEKSHEIWLNLINSYDKHTKKMERSTMFNSFFRMFTKPGNPYEISWKSHEMPLNPMSFRQGS